MLKVPKGVSQRGVGHHVVGVEADGEYGVVVGGLIDPADEHSLIKQTILKVEVIMRLIPRKGKNLKRRVTQMPPMKQKMSLLTMKK